MAGAIDIHAHAVTSAYRAALAAVGLGPPERRMPDWNPGLAIAMMDRNAIAASMLSLSVPGVHFGDDAKARAAARACNDEFAEIVAKNPGRFGAFAILPLPDVEGACAEAARALDTLKLDGVGLLSNHNGVSLGDPAFEPLMQVLDAHKAVAFIHPMIHPTASGIKLGVPNSLLEYPFDTTRAAVNLIFSNTLERHPNIRFILAHAGGTLPYLAWRIAGIAAWQIGAPADNEKWIADRYRVRLIDENPTPFDANVALAQMRRFYYDTALAPGRAALASLMETADPARVLFGSDWPYAYEHSFVADAARRLETEAPFDANELAAVKRGNALALFPRFA